MPSTSKKQHNFMAAVANNPSFAKKVGVPQSVGQDFNKADKGRKFSKGGDTMASKMNAGFMAMMAKKKGEGPSAMGKPVMKKGMDMAKDGMKKMASGGISDAAYNLGGYSDGGRLLRGPGDGVSDSIPAVIGKKQPARLADGEFVVPARIVSELGNGSTEAGARKLYAMMDRIQKARKKTVGKGKVAKNSRSEKYLPA
jgi:hypothetical protein